MDSRTRRNFDDIQVEHIGRSFGRMVQVRLHLSKVLLAVAMGAALLDGALWRIVGMGTILVLALVFFFYEARRFAREGYTTRSVPLNLWLGLLTQQGLVLCTGGIASPLLPTILPFAFVGSLVAPRGHRRWLMVVQLVVLVLMTWVQLAGWLPGLPLSFLGTASPAFLVTAVTVVAVLCMFGIIVSGALRSTFDGMLNDALTHRDELLATYQAHARELEALSGEIAHELKNPLATVKGLTQLMVREPGRPQAPERLRVLSAEVTRMQGILEEFLNFSRPLVPLTVSTVDLGALCDEALVLHEGLAVERGVKLEREGSGAVHAACDPRKVKQVVMNLLHNAIEASPASGRVVVTVEATGAGDARVSIQDEGPGLAKEVAGRVFEAGFTTKAKGTGLGLTVSRALARQHGGDVKLVDGPRGGCVAELVLPRELPAGALGPVREVVAHA